MSENANEIARHQIKECRRVVNAAADQATGRRPCPECGQPIIAVFGRWSQTWAYYHEHAIDCIFEDYRYRLKFKTRQEAIEAKEVFREPC